MTESAAPADPELAGRVRGLLPRLTDELVALMAVPSVASPGYRGGTRAALADAEHVVTRLLRDSGVEQAETIRLPDTAPVVFGEFPAPPGAPTVLLGRLARLGRS
jgi:acetylornithine deacetylase/succinyl-diaminopimelate desuccinylase-like protein